jgi:hypothetical protein
MVLFFVLFAVQNRYPFVFLSFLSFNMIKALLTPAHESMQAFLLITVRVEHLRTVFSVSLSYCNFKLALHLEEVRQKLQFNSLT